MTTRKPAIAVIGAGISGTICGRALASRGLPTTVFEKSRGVGGRMATRRTEGGVSFDHGAQYFTARDERFKRLVESLAAEGIVARWEAPIVVLEDGTIKEQKSGTGRYVAVPTMNAICKHLATDLEVHFQTHVAPLERHATGWQVKTIDGTSLGAYDLVVVSAPAGQTAALLASAPAVAGPAQQTHMDACWAVMLAFSDSLDCDFGGAFVHDSPLSWIACTSTKPGRKNRPEAWVLHGSTEWSHSHLEDSADSIADQLTDAFWNAIGRPPKRPDLRAAHRWRFSIPPEPLTESSLFDPELQAVACGDWCAGPRVEGAFLSGLSAADRVISLFH